MSQFDYSKTNLVIYHGGCPDGTAAAWCFWRAKLNKDASLLHYGQFSDGEIDVAGKHVVFVDFSYKRPVIEKMLESAASVRVLDHHKSANPLLEIEHPNFSIILDMNRSGAQIAWDETRTCDKACAPDEVTLAAASSRPWYIDDVADRDLWRWQIPGSKLTTRAMYGLGYSKNVWNFDKLRNIPRDYFITCGQPLVADDERQYAMIIKRAITCETLGQLKKYKIMAVECEHNMASEVGNRLCAADATIDFAACYRYDLRAGIWHISCRATRADIDLTTILPQFDPKSGGHAHAAGMELSDIRSVFVPCAN